MLAKPARQAAVDVRLASRLEATSDWLKAAPVQVQVSDATSSRVQKSPGGQGERPPEPGLRQLADLGNADGGRVDRRHEEGLTRPPGADFPQQAVGGGVIDLNGPSGHLRGGPASKQWQARRCRPRNRAGAARFGPRWELEARLRPCESSCFTSFSSPRSDGAASHLGRAGSGPRTRSAGRARCHPSSLESAARGPA